MWKDIKDFEGYYQVSDSGEVKSVARARLSKNGCICPVNERILKPSMDKDGYRRVTLMKDGRYYYYRICRLVAQAFIPNTSNYPVVNHKNEVKNDDRVCNLEWCTISYNTRYSIYKQSHKILCNDIEYPSINECARRLNIDSKSIRYCLKTGRKYKNKLTFKYI
jgi:hypothetical protein